MIGHDPSIEELLVPQPFKRGNYSAHLYAPYSYKLRRRAYIYGHLSYDVWVLLESNPEIKKYNERAPSIPIALNTGKAANLSPSFISQTIAGQITLHNIVATNEIAISKQTEIDGWKNYCELRDFEQKTWTLASLLPNEYELANLKRLMRFASAMFVDKDLNLEKSILYEIKNHRKIVLFQVLQQFPKSDQESVKCALARLVFDKKIFTNIHLQPFYILTELSAHHEFPAR